MEDLARDRRVRGSGWLSPPGFGGCGSAVDRPRRLGSEDVEVGVDLPVRVRRA